MNTEYIHFFETIRTLINITPEEQQIIYDTMNSLEFEKDEHLVQTGDINGNLFFIHKGLVRFVYTTEDGREFNKSFAAESGFIGCLRSILTQQPCRFSIQALEYTKTLSISAEAQKRIWDNIPEWEHLGRVLAERLALKKEEREAEFLLDSAEKRYQRFITENPSLIERIPQYHIASYLGITDVALSRIRKRIESN